MSGRNVRISVRRKTSRPGPRGRSSGGGTTRIDRRHVVPEVGKVPCVAAPSCADIEHPHWTGGPILARELAADFRHCRLVGPDVGALGVALGRRPPPDARDRPPLPRPGHPRPRHPGQATSAAPFRCDGGSTGDPARAGEHRRRGRRPASAAGSGAVIGAAPAHPPGRRRRQRSAGVVAQAGGGDSIPAPWPHSGIPWPRNPVRSDPPRATPDGRQPVRGSRGSGRAARLLMGDGNRGDRVRMADHQPTPDRASRASTNGCFRPEPSPAGAGIFPAVRSVDAGFRRAAPRASPPPLRTSGKHRRSASWTPIRVPPVPIDATHASTRATPASARSSRSSSPVPVRWIQRLAPLRC